MRVLWVSLSLRLSPSLFLCRSLPPSLCVCVRVRVYALERVQASSVDVSESSKKPLSSVPSVSAASERSTTDKVRVDAWVNKLELGSN